MRGILKALLLLLFVPLSWAVFFLMMHCYLKWEQTGDRRWQAATAIVSLGLAIGGGAFFRWIS